MQTIMMDDYAFLGLPVRQHLTGSPIQGQDYRDGDNMNAVYRWGFLQDPDGVTGFAGRAGWIEMRRVRPAP